VITGSVGGTDYYKNLGKTGAGQAPGPTPVPTSLRQAVEQAVAPMPRPRPAEAPRDLGQRFRPMPEEPFNPNEVTHSGAQPGRDQNVSIFNPAPDYRSTTGAAPTYRQADIPGPQGPFTPPAPTPQVAGSPFSTTAPSFPGPRGAPSASGLRPSMLPVPPPLTTPTPMSSWGGGLVPVQPRGAAPPLPMTNPELAPHPLAREVVPPSTFAPPANTQPPGSVTPLAMQPPVPWWMLPENFGPGFGGGAGYGMPGSTGFNFGSFGGFGGVG